MSKGFDLQVHHYDSKGKVARTNPYRLSIEAGKREFERPVGSGQWYAEDGTMVRDESKEVRAKLEAEAAEAQAKQEAQAAEAREALKAQIRAELEAEAKEQKAVKHGASTKA